MNIFIIDRVNSRFILYRENVLLIFKLSILRISFYGDCAWKCFASAYCIKYLGAELY